MRQLRKKAAVFTLALAFAGISLPTTVHADGEQNSPWSKYEVGVTTKMGTDAISHPSTSSNNGWLGDYVYYGKYNGSPVRYRVLDPESTDFWDDSNNNISLNTMFLDCDTILTTGKFGSTNTNWKSDNCDLRLWMNGYFLNNSFTTVENSAIPAVWKQYSESESVVQTNYYLIGLTYHERIFPLDMKDIYNPDYGYNSKGSRKKSNALFWWLRTRANNANKNTHAATITNEGGHSAQPVTTDTHGYSPAFNVLQDNIIFASKVNPDNTGTYGNEFKLTLKDTAFGVTTSSSVSADVTADRTTITVPYMVTDGDESLDPNTVSVLIQSKTDNSILKYSPLSGTYTASGPNTFTGTGTFELPGTLSLDGWGTDYNVSILAEDVNGIYETDYASEPQPIGVPVVRYGITVSDTINGTVTANKEYAELGETVTLTLTPANNYTISALTINDTTVYPMSMTHNTDGTYTYSFTMPAENVTVSAEFAENTCGASFVGYSLSLKDDIGLNMYFDINQSVIDNPNTKMVITVPEIGVTEISVNNFRPDDKTGYYVFRADVAAKQMTDEVVCELYTDAEEPILTKNASVREAAVTYLKRYPADSYEYKVVRAMLNYGYYSQVYFNNYNINKPANAGYETSVDDIDVNSVSAYKYTGSDLLEDVVFAGSALALEAKIEILLYFEVPDDKTIYFYNGDVPITPIKSGGYTIISINGAAIEDLGKGIPITISDGEKTYTVTFNQLNHAYDALSHDSVSEGWKNVIKALYKYYIAAVGNPGGDNNA